MKILNRKFILFSFAICMMLAASAPVFPAEPASDKADIQQIRENCMKAVNAGDLVLMFSLWDENGIKMNPDAAVMIGKSEIKSRIAGISSISSETW